MPDEKAPLNSRRDRIVSDIGRIEHSQYYGELMKNSKITEDMTRRHDKLYIESIKNGADSISFIQLHDVDKDDLISQEEFIGRYASVYAFSNARQTISQQENAPKDINAQTPGLIEETQKEFDILLQDAKFVAQAQDEFKALEQNYPDSQLGDGSLNIKEAAAQELVFLKAAFAEHIKITLSQSDVAEATDPLAALQNLPKLIEKTKAQTGK